MAKLINGKEISQQIKDELKEKVSALKAQGKNICLAVIQVGNDPASSVYVGNKKKACAYIGIESRAFELPEETTEEELLSIIKDLNEDDGVHGILVQLRFQSTSMKRNPSMRSLRRRMWMDSIRRALAACVLADRDSYRVHQRESSSF